MPAEEFLYRQNEFLIIGTLLVVLLIATETGYRRGRAARVGIEDPAKSHYWTLQTGMMGLLALLLAFTFSMSVSRYEARKRLLVDEADSLRTTYLRSRMLPEPFRSQVAGLIDNYVGCRLQDYGAARSEEETEIENLKCQKLQNQIWLQAIGAVSKDPHPVPSGLFVTSLNESIEIAARRDAERQNHVPQPVLIFLLMVTTMTMGLLGYGCGLGNHRHIAATATVCLLLSLVILIILDLDCPRRGLITISQQPMIELRASLHGSADPNVRDATINPDPKLISNE